MAKDAYGSYTVSDNLVLAHSLHRDEIYQRLLSLKEKKIAIEYLGEIPEDWAVVL